MAGPGTNWLNQKAQTYQQIVEQAQSAQQKLAIINQAKALIGKETLTQADAEQLVELVLQSS